MSTRAGDEGVKSCGLTRRLDSNMICAVAGMTADANILINYARQAAQRYLLTYNEEIPCEQLVRRLCDLKQGYTQHGGLRPFGVSFIYAGYDPHRQFQLYQSNPSGNYGGWKATSVGANNASAQSLLKQDYKEDCDLQEACGLAVKVLSKTMDSTKLSSEKSKSLSPLVLPLALTTRQSSLPPSVGPRAGNPTIICGERTRSPPCSGNTSLPRKRTRTRASHHLVEAATTVRAYADERIERESIQDPAYFSTMPTFSPYRAI